MSFDQIVQDQHGVEGTEYLVFPLGDQEYGIDILCIQEIRGADSQQVTTIANMPEFVRGITNLRGMIVPIIDLRMKLNLPKIEYTNRTVMVILNLCGSVIGVIVDGVSDVINLRPDQVKDVPQFHSTVARQYLTGIGTAGDRMTILLNIEKLMGSEGMALIEQAAA
ncbi:MAG: chemotaxis protein CheW [Alcaligenaceae bacterium]|nr:chemotaxis protein CheW [Alcaligenaceae bacterium]